MKCNNCGTKVVRFPLKDDEGKLIVKNLFKMDLMSIIGIIVIIILAVTYKADIKECEAIIINPLEYCEESNACKIIEERKNENTYDVIDIGDIPEIDAGG